MHWMLPAFLWRSLSARLIVSARQMLRFVTNLLLRGIRDLLSLSLVPTVCSCFTFARAGARSLDGLWLFTSFSTLLVFVFRTMHLCWLLFQ